MPAGKNAVYKKVQLRVLKIATCKIAAPASGEDVEVCLLKKRDVAAYGLALYDKAVVLLQVLGDVLLLKRMVRVAVFLQYLKYS